MGKAALKIFFGILVFQYVIAAPSDVKPEEGVEIKQAEEAEKKEPTPLEVSPTATLLDEIPEDTTPLTTPQSPRQKRWYNYYGFPPVNPSFFNRDDSFNTAGFGLQDPLVLIHRRLQDINNSFRQQPPPLPPPQLPPGFSQFPGFVPIIYIPQVGCGCTPNTPQRPNNKPSRPARPQNNNPNITSDPGVETRWPEMEDERQNWGIVPGDTNDNQDIEDDGDGNRPISFEPIRPNRPMRRPAPPLDHGTVEGNTNSGGSGSSGNTGDSGTQSTTTFRPAEAPSNGGLQPPSNCDSAILRCCHLPQVTYDCFAYQGCPDPSSYGNPCDSAVIARVIDRFLRFYGQKNG